MIPIRDTIDSRHPPIATWLLIALNGVVFAIELGLPPEGLVGAVSRLGVVPALLTHPGSGARIGLLIPPYWSLLTALFLHGGWIHLIGNMWTLAIFGDDVEGRMGPARFVLFYFLCGLLAGAVHVLVNPDATMPAIRASGAIAGVMGAYLVLFPRARIVVLVPPLFVEMPAFLFLAYWFLVQLWSGMLAIASTDHAQNIAFWAHVGGFAAGILLFRPFLGPEEDRPQGDGGATGPDSRAEIRGHDPLPVDLPAEVPMEMIAGGSSGAVDGVESSQ